MKSIFESMLASDSSSEDFSSFMSPYAAARNECHRPGASLSTSSWGAVPTDPFCYWSSWSHQGGSSCRGNGCALAFPSFLQAVLRCLPGHLETSFSPSFLPLPPLPALQFSQIRRFHEAPWPPLLVLFPGLSVVGSLSQPRVS